MKKLGWRISANGPFLIEIKMDSTIWFLTSTYTMLLNGKHTIIMRVYRDTQIWRVQFHIINLSVLVDLRAQRNNTSPSNQIELQDRRVNCTEYIGVIKSCDDLCASFGLANRTVRLTDIININRKHNYLAFLYMWKSYLGLFNSNRIFSLFIFVSKLPVEFCPVLSCGHIEMTWTPSQYSCGHFVR